MCLLVATVAALPSVEQLEMEAENLFQTFVQEHKKVYHPHEVLNRFAIFKDNLKFIEQHNANPANTYTVGVNQFADMTNAEFKRTMTGLNALQNKVQDNVVVLPVATAAAVDWTTAGAVTPVKNQGQCGSCWAFSTTGSVEGINQITTGKLLSFSEQELVDCASAYGNQGCNGGLMDNGFQYIQAKGDVLETTYPYTGTTGTCSKTKSANSAVKLSGFADVTVNSEDQLMAAVQQQPVSVAIEADQSGFQLYKSGVFSGTCGTALDHGVLAVGYGTDSTGTDYWKVKNSWGSTWGLNGFILLKKGMGGAGQCGIASAASYPTMTKAVLTQVNVPQGTYKGVKKVLGGLATVTGTITYVDATHADISFVITGAAKADIECKDEDAVTDASGAITLPNAGTAGDCVHDQLEATGAKINSILYSATADTITINLFKDVDVVLVLTKQ